MKTALSTPARSRRLVIVARELIIVLTFCFFTALLTWPYVTRMRDAVVDKGDPYLMAWIMWWDYHATFTNPLHLFDANIFYPLKYSLAFSEHAYGLSLLFFPLYFIGLKPLTVQTVAVFFAFAVSGYGAFRLGRTLTGSTAVGWVSGIIFAFVPYRFNMMSQVVYLFSPWMPLVFEALVLFARDRSRKHTIWLGCAFFMNGITTITWFTFTLIPFAVFAAILLTRYRLWRDRDFWWRAGVALTAAVVALLPFMVPYVLASRLYGFTRTIEEIKQNSALPSHWLAADIRNKLWNRIGEGVFDGWKFRLFPGLLPIVFSLVALFGWRRSEPQHSGPTLNATARAWLPRLFALIIARSRHRSDAFWLGSILTVLGFCFSLGWNFFFYRICYQLLPMFKSMRMVTRGALLTYLGLALLSGLGVQRVAEWINRRYPRFQVQHVFIAAGVLLLLEFNAAPLRIERGDPFPDAVTLRLKATPMRGGIVYLPAGGDNNYPYMLRAADHAKPLIVGTSGFNSPIEDKIENLTRSGQLSDQLMTLLESVPASYLIIANNAVPPDRIPEYQAFLRRQLSTGRLRFINRFDGRDDLYAVVKTEPETKTEAALPFDPGLRDWSSSIHEYPAALLGPLNMAQKLYRFQLVTSGSMPRYEPFKTDLEEVTRGVIVGSEAQQQQFAENFQRFVEAWMKRESFTKNFDSLNDAQFVNKLIANAGIDVPLSESAQLVDALASGKETRATVLLKIVNDPRLVQKEQNRSLVALHYFAYLRRNPDDPPDGDLRGFNFWVSDQERRPDLNKLSSAFKQAFEYEKLLKQH